MMKINIPSSFFYVVEAYIFAHMKPNRGVFQEELNLYFLKECNLELFVCKLLVEKIF